MGQYLAIGLPRQIFVTPERTYNQTISLEDVREEMERSLHYEMSLFEWEDREKMWIFTLKNEPLKEGLIPFLESFYPRIYPRTQKYAESENERGYLKALETLRTTPFEQWFDFAREKSNYAFHMGTCSALQYLELQKYFRPSVRLRLDCLSLYVGNGKIITEGIDDFTTFFKFCFREAFSEHPIAKAIEIYVTG